MVRAFDGLLYRALNPRWAADPLSGEGAAIHGGRFNPRGMPALYTSLSPITAMKEAQQAGSFQPITLVAYEARIERLVDGRDTEALAALGVTPMELADPGWRDTMLGGGKAPTQLLGVRLKSEGFQGLLVPSFVPGAETDDLNIVLLDWSGNGGAKLRVIDDEDRLQSLS